jgi:hypothetical protein
MKPSDKGKLLAIFPGLVDICETDEGQLAYLTDRDGEFVLVDSVETTTGATATPPDRDHFPFLLPRASEVLTWLDRDDPTLYTDVLAYLRRFSALDDLQWSLVAHYVFLTYLHDHPQIDYCPYLLFYAVPERGKSRTGKSVAYVAFRGIHLIELREANIFRYSQHLHGTLFFDLMDVSKKAERSGCDDILLLRAEKGAKCSRVLYPDQGAFRDTVYYDIYGPTIIASNEELHKILHTRCLPIIMPNRPGHYDNPRPELALPLKERLTAWRGKMMRKRLPAPPSPFPGITGRLWDIAYPLFLVGQYVNPGGQETLYQAILAIAGDRADAQRGTVEGRLVGIIRELTGEKGLDWLDEWELKTADVLRKYNENRPEDKHVTAQWIGQRLGKMSIRRRTVNGRSEILLTQGEYQALLNQYGHQVSETLPNEANPTKTLPEIIEQNQHDMGLVGFSRVSERTPGADDEH